MAISDALGERRTAGLPAGTVEYRERGTGRPVVFVHGVGVNGDLWRKVVPGIADAGYRCIAPDLPLGAHAQPMRPDADLSLPGLARIVADLIAALELEDAVVVANDTGGAVAQWLVGHHAERVGALVLTSCDAFEKFPPRPQLYLKPFARIKPLLWLTTWAVALKPFQRTPTAYGWTTKRPIDARVMRGYARNIRSRGARRDLRRLLLAVDTRYTFEAGEALRSFDKPALVVWAADDRLFPREHGKRLAELLPQGRFTTIADSRTFIPEEQPARLVALVLEFLGAGASAPTAAV